MVVDSTIYGITRQRSYERFASHIGGPLSSFFLVVAEKGLGETAQEALDKSARALGWHEGATFIWLQNSDGTTLSQAELFEVIEGLDPLCIVLAGKTPREYAATAFRSDIPTLGHFRLFGRDACAFDNLESLLATNTGKQTAWSLLRALPRASSQ